MKKLSIVIIALLAVLVCCKKTPEVNIQYVDVEREVLNIGSTTANIQCDYEYIATLKSAKLYYGKTEDNMNYVNMRVVQSVLYAEITGLKSGTTYKYYYEFENGFNSMQSEVKTFTTEESPTTVVSPTVVTSNIAEITAESAVGGGEVTSDGGGDVSARGVCWSTSPNPTLSDSFTTDGTGIGSFVSNLTGLSNNTTYHVRAYATNEAGTAYGLDKTFTTLDGGGSDVPTGAINGLFTINDNGDKVYFSQGNLQYQASTNTWRFAENQWDFVGSSEVYFWHPGGNVSGSSNHLISPSYSGWIDLFGWGTSGYNHGAICYQPWSTSNDNSQYYAYGDAEKNLNDETGQADWGYNPISNGGNIVNIWRTMTRDEWIFIMSNRSTTSSIRFAKANVNETNGLILLPDDWNSSIYCLNSPNDGGAPYSSNVITLSNWSTLESSGAVFLPITGLRTQEGCGWIGNGYYQTASLSNEDVSYVHNLVFQNDILYFSGGLYSYRYKGSSIRLVQDYNNK